MGLGDCIAQVRDIVNNTLRQFFYLTTLRSIHLIDINNTFNQI